VGERDLASQPLDFSVRSIHASRMPERVQGCGRRELCSAATERRSAYLCAPL
jgi:hypothetical protein